MMAFKVRGCTAREKDYDTVMICARQPKNELGVVSGVGGVFREESKKCAGNSRRAQSLGAGGGKVEAIFSGAGRFRESFGCMPHENVRRTSKPAALHIDIALIVDVIDGHNGKLSPVRTGELMTGAFAALAGAKFGRKPVQSAKVGQFAAICQQALKMQPFDVGRR